MLRVYYLFWGGRAKLTNQEQWWHHAASARCWHAQTRRRHPRGCGRPL